MYTSYLHKNWQSMVRIRVGCYMNNDIQPLFRSKIGQKVGVGCYMDKIFTTCSIDI